MKYVVDSSVAFKWAIVENDTDKARRIRARFSSGVIQLLAPDIYPVEISHALTRSERQKRITATESVQFFRDFLGLLPALIPSLTLLPRAHAISSNMRCGVYDCLYVALAEREGCEFLTADTKLVNSLQAAFSFIAPLSSQP